MHRGRISPSECLICKTNSNKDNTHPIKSSLGPRITGIPRHALYPRALLCPVRIHQHSSHPRYQRSQTRILPPLSISVPANRPRPPPQPSDSAPLPSRCPLFPFLPLAPALVHHHLHPLHPPSYPHSPRALVRARTHHGCGSELTPMGPRTMHGRVGGSIGLGRAGTAGKWQVVGGGGG